MARILRSPCLTTGSCSMAAVLKVDSHEHHEKQVLLLQRWKGGVELTRMEEKVEQVEVEAEAKAVLVL